MRNLPMKVVDRYLAREFAYSYVVSVLIMMSLYIVLDLFANIDEFLETDRSTRLIIGDITRYYGYHSFLYFAQGAGMITLVAACFTLARLQRSNELVAMLAGGISLYRVALPLIAVGMIFNTLWVVDQELIIPQIADKLAVRHDEAKGRQSFPLWFLSDRNNTLLSAIDYDPESQTMDEMIAMERDSDGQIIAKISAAQAVWDDEHQRWSLTRGARYARSANEAEFVVSGRMGRTPIDFYHSDWKPNDLLLRQYSGWTRYLSLRQLSNLLRNPTRVPNINEIVSARHARLTQPIVNVLLLLLGLPFFLNREPHNVLLSVGMCLLVAIICFMLAFVSQNIASTTAYPALLAWLPILIFGPVAAILMENIKT